MASNPAETVITEMSMQTTKYVAGAKRMLDINRQLVESVNQVKAAYASVAAAGFAVPSGSVTGSFGSKTLSLGAGFVPGAGPTGSMPSNVGSMNVGTINAQFVNMRGGASGGASGGGSGSSTSGGSGGFMSAGGWITLGYAIVQGASMAVHALKDVAEKLVSFGADALKEYASFDTLTRSFEGIYGSSEKAAQMMNYLRDAAMHSAFQFKDLADAARGISVAGLDVNRFLPIVQGFALAMGQVNGEGLEDFVSILRRIQGGNTQLALGPRGIGRYGVSRQELEAQGAQFDQRNHFTGSANQAYDAIEGVFKTRIQKIAQSVSASSEVVLSNLTDSFHQATIDIGAGLMQNLIEPIKLLTTSVNNLRASGALKDLGDTIGGIIVPGGLSGTKSLADAWKDAHDNKAQLRGEGSSLEAFKEAVDPMTKILISIGGAIVTMVSLLSQYVDNGKDAVDFMGKLGVSVATGITGAPVATLTKLTLSQENSMAGRAAQLGEGYENAAYQALSIEGHRQFQNKGAQAPNPPAGNRIPADDDDAGNNLRKIREHTERMARHMDERAQAFGGGDLARMGVTAVELSGARGLNGRNHAEGIRGIMAHVGDALSQEIDRMVQQALHNGLRQGYMAGRYGN